MTMAMTGVLSARKDPRGRKPIVRRELLNAAKARFREFLDRDWKYWMTEYPEFATIFGYPGQNGRWTDYSPEAIERRNRHLESGLKELHTLRRIDLPAEEQLNYDLYEDLYKTAIAGLRFHDDAFPLPEVTPSNLYMPVTQMDGVLTNLPETIELMPAARPSDYEDIIRRLESFPILVDQAIALMNQGMAQGWTPPKITMRDVPKQAADQIVSDPLKSTLLGAFKKFPPEINAQQQKDLHAASNRRLSRQSLARSGETAKLSDEHLHSQSAAKIFPSPLFPDGAEYYKYLVKWHTTTNLTPAQIHQIGLDQVKEIRAQIDQLIAQSGFKGGLSEFAKFLNTDARFKFSSAGELLAYVRDIAKRADPQTARLFGTLPRLPYGVKPVPDAIAPSQSEAYYEPGTPEAGRPGYVNINTYNLSSRQKWDMEDLFLHEGVPGHHLQIALAQELPDRPAFRKNLGYTAYTEGWGLYAESLGEEMGFYADPYSRFGYLSGQMWRAVRLVLDTGIHSMGWTREQALQYFRDNTGQPEQNVISETDRYIVWPGQALGYKIGQLKFLDLRRKAETESGGQFDIRKFHDSLLDEGALPLTILEQRVENGAAAQGTSPAKSH